MLVDGLLAWSFAAGITGVGMALLYPTLIAAVGALLLGLIADTFNSLEAGFWFRSVAMALSGFWVAVAMNETKVLKTSD